MWVFIVWVLPAIVLASTGIAVGLWGAGFGLASIWLGFCVAKGSIILSHREFALVERLGRYQTVYFEGWNVLVIGVDTVRNQGFMRTERLRMYTNENGRTDRAVMDFACGGSAPIDASVWYHIGDPQDIRDENWTALREDIKKWTYAYANPVERIDNLVDDELRPLIQAETIDSASTKTKRSGIANEVMTSVAPELRAIGVYPPDDGKNLTIEDIDLPDAIIAIRELKLKGEKESEENVSRALGYWKPIKEIADKLSISVEKAREIYETQRGLETLREVKPTMTLVGENMKNVLGTVNLGGKP